MHRPILAKASELNPVTQEWIYSIASVIVGIVIVYIAMKVVRGRSKIRQVMCISLIVAGSSIVIASVANIAVLLGIAHY
jgi:hypothetical protein